jgi:hypothetical protein
MTAPIKVWVLSGTAHNTYLLQNNENANIPAPGVTSSEHHGVHLECSRVRNRTFQGIRQFK